MVLTEAFAAGTPVVASEIAGYADVVSDGVDGILIPPGDPQRLAEELQRAASRARSGVAAMAIARPGSAEPLRLAADRGPGRDASTSGRSTLPARRADRLTRRSAVRFAPADGAAARPRPRGFPRRTRFPPTASSRRRRRSRAASASAPAASSASA